MPVCSIHMVDRLTELVKVCALNRHVFFQTPISVLPWFPTSWKETKKARSLGFSHVCLSLQMKHCRNNKHTYIWSGSNCWILFKWDLSCFPEINGRTDTHRYLPRIVIHSDTCIVNVLNQFWLKPWYFMAQVLKPCPSGVAARFLVKELDAHATRAGESPVIWMPSLSPLFLWGLYAPVMRTLIQ